MQEPSYFDYIKAAFGHRHPVKGLGRMPVNILGLATFGVLGLANPGFWFLGAALELGYLVWLSNNPTFRKTVRGRRLLADKQSYADRMQAAVERLSSESQRRFQKLFEESRRIASISEALGETEIAGVKKLRGSGLNQLLWIFLRMLTSREVLATNLQRVDRQQLAAEIAGVEERLAAAAGDPALERSLRATLEIRRKRLENLDKAARSRQVIDAELERIEQQVVLIREEAAVGGKAEMLSSRLDSVTTALSETNSWMEQNAAIFGELGADPLGSAPADLPEIPLAIEGES